jgi:predicted small lipoprotein YifL
MKTLIGAAALLLAAAALSACGTKRNPNMPTAEEDAKLNEAAAMVNSRESPVANDDLALGNGDEGSSEDSVGEDAGNAAGNAQ